MRTWALLAASVIALAGCAGGHEPTDSPTPASQGEPAAPVEAKPLIIDVRSQAEWDAGHLDGAILIPHTQIGDRIAQVAPDKAQPIFLHCRSGRRTGAALATLERLGYTNVENVGTLADARKRFPTP